MENRLFPTGFTTLGKRGLEVLSLGSWERVAEIGPES